MPATLVITARGHGPALVLLPGWSMHSAIWGAFGERLEEHFCVYRVDLPGHGAGHLDTPWTLAEAARRIAGETPSATWLGWSLGGLLALQAAHRHPRQVNRLVLLACNPCFVACPGWPEGMSPDLFQQFRQGIESDPDSTLRRFSGLMVQGADAAPQTLRQLRALVATCPRPGPLALRAGLQQLASNDLHQHLGGIHQPALLIAGEQDQLAPPTAMQRAATNLPDAEVHCIPGAGHAPFISHTEAVLAPLLAFQARARAA